MKRTPLQRSKPLQQRQPLHARRQPRYGAGELVTVEGARSASAVLGRVLGPVGAEIEVQIVEGVDAGAQVLLPPGRLRKLAGLHLAAAKARLARGAQGDPCFAPAPAAAGLPPLQVIHVGPVQLRPVPKARAPFRMPDFLRFVRTFACCGCCASAPTEAHHAGPRGVRQKADDPRTAPLCARCHRLVTDTGCLPGLSLEETMIRLLKVEAAILTEWIVLMERSAAVPVYVLQQLIDEALDGEGLTVRREGEVAA